MLTSSSDGLPVLEPKNVVRRRFVMTLGVAAVVAAIVLLLAGQGSADKIVGSGSTFAQPLIERGAVGFQDARAGDGDWTSGSAGVEYEPVGSLGGIMRLQDPEVDFAVTDYPLSADGLAKYDAVQFPIAIGSLSPVYNLKGLVGPLNLAAPTLAGIFSGRITTWADPRIAADNPGVALPQVPIKVIYRQDGSGSTFNFSSFLARHDAAWRDSLGAATTLRWPAGLGVKGSDGMAKGVAAQDGAIGYLETGQARRAKLAVAALRNPAGRFVAADEASITAGARDAGLAGEAPATAASAAGYPLVTAIYGVMKRNNRTAGDNQRAARFLAFLLDHGDAQARALGYLPLSPASAAKVRRTWSDELKLDIPTSTLAAQ